MPKCEPIVLTWAEWKASREQKRANLRAFGLDMPSCRTHGVGKADWRLRAAFDGKRAPSFSLIQHLSAKADIEATGENVAAVF